jgi:hypothetical protein
MRKPMPRRISNDELDDALAAIHRHLEFTDLPASRDQVRHEVQNITGCIERKRERAKEEEVKRIMEQYRRELMAHQSSARRPRYQSYLAARRPLRSEPGYWAAQILLRALELLTLFYRVRRGANLRYYRAGYEEPPRVPGFDDPGADRNDAGIRRMAATTIFMYVGFIFWILLAATFSSVLPPGAAGVVAGAMTVVIGLLVRAVIACSRNVRLSWGAREPAPAAEIWKPRD